MRNILVEINCPTCGYHKHIKSHTLVLPELEPELRKRILAHTMFTYRCPRCAQKIIFLHNFIYHDKAHHFLIYMGEDDHNLDDFQQQFPDTIIRHVDSPSQLEEKIRIFEDGFDDRILSILTLQLKRKYPDTLQILYHDVDRESHSLWFTFRKAEGDEIKGIDMDIYHTYKKRYEPICTPSYVINEAWAKQCLSKDTE